MKVIAQEIMDHKGKETKLYKLNKEIKKLQEDQRFEQEEERKKLQDEQNQLEADKKKHSDEQIKFLKKKEQHTKMMEREIEEMKKEKEEQKIRQKKQNQLEVDKKKHADEEMRFLRHKEQHARMMEKEIEEMKKEKEAQKIRQKKFYDEVKKFAAKERKFGVWKEHKSKKELDLEEREKNVLLKENANKTLSRQLTIQMTIHEEKERINERKVLDKEAEFKVTREELSSEKQRFTSAEVEFNKEKKDVAEQKKKNDYMLSLLKTKKVS